MSFIGSITHGGHPCFFISRSAANLAATNGRTMRCSELLRASRLLLPASFAPSRLRPRSTRAALRSR